MGKKKSSEGRIRYPKYLEQRHKENLVWREEQSKTSKCEIPLIDISEDEIPF